MTTPNKILTASLSIKNFMWSQDNIWIVDTYGHSKLMKNGGQDSLVQVIFAQFVEEYGHKLSSSQLEHTIQMKGEFTLKLKTNFVINVDEDSSSQPHNKSNN